MEFENLQIENNVIQQQKFMISELMNQTRKQIDLFNQTNHTKDGEINFLREELMGSEALVKDLKQNVFHFKDVAEGLEDEIAELKCNNELLNRKYEKRSDEIKQYFEEKDDAVRMYQNEKEIMEEKMKTLIIEKEIMEEKVKTLINEKEKFQNHLIKSCTLISVEEDNKSLNVLSTNEVELVHLHEEVQKLTNEVSKLEMEKSEKEMLLENMKYEKNDLHEKLIISNSKYRQLDSEMDALKNRDASEEC